MIRSKKIRSSAKGEKCTVRLFPGECWSRETTVLAHLPGGGKGRGLKGNDIHAAYACGLCHGLIDGAISPPTPHGASWPQLVAESCLRALGETQRLLHAKGLLEVAA